MTRAARTIAIVGWFDFLESIRSKKAIALLVLYLAGSLAATGVFVRVLHAIESTVADTLKVSRTERAGAMTEEVMRSEQLLDTLDELVGDRALAKTLVSMPPLALFYGWLALTFIPLLVTLTSGDSVSSDVSSGSVRFALFRSDRLSWALGKLLGQMLLMTSGIFAGALGAWIIGWIFLSGFHAIDTAWWLLRFSGRAWFYGFAYLGVAMGCSLVTRSVNVSRGLSLFMLFVFGLVGNLLETRWIRKDILGSIADTLVQLFPQGHDLDLWRPELADRMPALVMLPALGLLYFALGYARFARRDR